MQTSGSHTQAYFILPLTFFFRNMSSCIFFFVVDIFILVIFEKKDNRTLIHVLEFKKSLLSKAVMYSFPNPNPQPDTHDSNVTLPVEAVTTGLS